MAQSMMLNATAVVSAELLESLKSRERACVPVAKTPVDLAKEMGTDEVYKKREEMEAAVARNEAEVRQLAAAMAVLGTELVGSDTCARAGELVPVIMAGTRMFSELVELFTCSGAATGGCRRHACYRRLCDAVLGGRSGRIARQRRGLCGRDRWRCGSRAPHLIRACRGCAMWRLPGLGGACCHREMCDAAQAVARE